MKMEFDYINDELKLKYPCPWVYKLIGRNAGKIRTAISEAVAGDDYQVKFSNFSAKGNYICMNLEITVDSESHRTEIFEALKKHSEIKMVL